MSLLAAVAARDLGFIDLETLVDRTEATLDHDRAARAAPGTPAQLVRHADAGAADAALCVHRGQRQPRRIADVPGRGAAGIPQQRAGAGASARRAAGAAGRPGAGAVRGDGLRLPLRPAAAAVRHRLPAAGRGGAGPARSVVLRPAGLGSPPRQLPGHRQGRRAAEPLVPPRPPAHQPSRRAGAAVVERDGVRVPDAAAADAQLSRHPARRVVPAGRGTADRVRAGPGRAVGHLGIGVRRRRSPRHLPVQGLRRARARPHPRPRRRAGGGARTPPRSAPWSIRWRPPPTCDGSNARAPAASSASSSRSTTCPATSRPIGSTRRPRGRRR